MNNNGNNIEIRSAGLLKKYKHFDFQFIDVRNNDKFVFVYRLSIFSSFEIPN